MWKVQVYKEGLFSGPILIFHNSKRSCRVGTNVIPAITSPVNLKPEDVSGTKHMMY